MLGCDNDSMPNTTDPEQEDTTSSETERLVHYFTMTIGIPLVCGFGMLGNVLNLMVLTREKIANSLTKMEKSAHIGLIALAVSDFMFCLLAFTFTQLPNEGSYESMSFVLYYEWLGPSLITVFIITSTWLTVVMAAERYVAVCHPFKARKIISLRKTRITIFVIYGICMAMTIPLGFEQIVQETICERGDKRYLIERRPEFTNSIIAIRRLIWAILFDFIPCVALLYFNTCLIYKIHRAKAIRNAMAPVRKSSATLLTKHPRELFSYNVANSNTSHTSQAQLAQNKPDNQPLTGVKRLSLPSKSASPTPSKTVKRRKPADSALNSVTATLVAVIVLFLILVSPSEILKFIYITTVGPGTSTFKIIQLITNLMQAVNFSVNFILYCAVNKSFRTSLAAIFCFFKNRPFHLPSFKKAYCHTVEYSYSDSDHPR